MVRWGPRPKRDPVRQSDAVRDATREVWSLLRGERPLRLFLVANALWELALAALKTFVVLYVTEGLGHTLGFASGAIGVMAVFILAGAVTSGRLADRIGAGRVMEAALWVYGAGLLVPFLLSGWPVAVAVAGPVVAFGGGVLMTLPFALLMPLMPSGQHGAVTGYYSVSRGLGITLGPVLAGAAISLGRPLLESTDGYAAMWGVCAVAVLASIPVLRSLRAAAAG
jgi:predicted MFS family arabinose efflux permease